MPRIGITLGDVSGIGPEVTLKALALEPADAGTRYLVLGNARLIQGLNETLGLGLALTEEPPGGADSRFAFHDPAVDLTLPERLTPGAPEAAHAALAYLRDATRRCLAGELDAVVTAPVNKESIIRTAAPSFVGQTEFLSELAGTAKTAMMLLGEDDRGRWLRVALATTHLPIRRVAESLSREKVELAIALAAQACRDLRLPRARVAVCGLNPHAGEGGKVGTEEIEIIQPAVEGARARGVDVTGPLAADTLFYYAYRGDYDAVVAMYHDQGLVPLKMIGFERGVNWTLGLPFIRTSPDHGTAYDIAGRGRADPSSMTSALALARQLCRGGKG